jgi:hypothetical protein
MSINIWMSYVTYGTIKHMSVIFFRWFGSYTICTHCMQILTLENTISIET